MMWKDIPYEQLFHQLHPGFFETKQIRDIPNTEIYEEMVLPLTEFQEDAVQIEVPEAVRFGIYEGDRETLLASVGAVMEHWVPLYRPEDRVYCATLNGEITSFCLMEDMGTFDAEGGLIRVAGPGCVGTVPAFRKKGIGLKMIQKVTEIFRTEGYNLSYIHYTGVAPFYAKLGYRTVLRWNRDGFLSPERIPEAPPVSKV